MQTALGLAYMGGANCEEPPALGGGTPRSLSLSGLSSCGQVVSYPCKHGAPDRPQGPRDRSQPGDDDAWFTYRTFA